MRNVRNFNLNYFSSAHFIALSHSDFEGTFVRGHSWTDRDRTAAYRPTDRRICRCLGAGGWTGTEGRDVERDESSYIRAFSQWGEKDFGSASSPTVPPTQAEAGRPTYLSPPRCAPQAGAGFAAASLSRLSSLPSSRGLLFRKALLVRRSVGRSVAVGRTVL